MGLGHGGLGLLHAPGVGLLGRLGGLQGRAGLLEVGGGDDAGLAVGPGALEVGLGLGHGRGGRGQVGLGGLEAGLHGVGDGPGVPGVDLHEELAPGDAIPLLHGQAGDLAHDIGGDVGLGDRLDLAVGADLRLQVLPAHRSRLHGNALVPRAGDAEAPGHYDHQTATKNPPLFPFHGKALPINQ